MMDAKPRAYQGEDDYWRVREFLREVYVANGRRELAWQPYRFDYWRWHINANITRKALEEIVLLWETADGRLVAVLNPEDHGDVFLQIHPQWRSAELANEMLALAEERLAVAGEDGRRSLQVWASELDAAQQGVLTERGYARAEGQEYHRRRPLDTPIPDAELAPGFVVRSLGEGAELLDRCYASGLAFHPDDIMYAVNNRNDVSWYRSIQNAPLYRRDLDIVAIAPDGAVASFCTIWFDDMTRTGAFEPVATVPAYQRCGLGRAVMTEGLRRLQRIGATQATVGSYGPRAGAFYSALGFTEYDLGIPWTRSL